MLLHILWQTVLLARSFNICEIFTVEICMILTLPLEWPKVKHKYAN